MDYGLGLTFNGKPLPSGIGITSFAVSSPMIEVKDIDPPSLVGMIRTGRKISDRNIQMSIVLLGSSVRENIFILNKLYEWCYSAEPAKLFMPANQKSYLMAECEQYPPVDIAHCESEFSIVFRAKDPAFISKNEYSATVNGQWFHVGGTLPTFPIIRQTITGNPVNPTWHIDNDSAFITINGEVDAGELVIDCAKESITIDGEDITNMVTLESNIGIAFVPGNHKITGSNGAGGAVIWHTKTLMG